MQQHELRPPPGAKRPRKRVGRGNASGTGTYAGRGMKGQQSRSGARIPASFEGGQTPLVRRLPHRRGFRNPFRVEYTPVNLRALEKFASGSEVTPESLREHGVVRSLRQPIKILGDGDLSVALRVRSHRVSAAARAKIEAAGGTVEELAPREAKEPSAKKKRAEKKPEPEAQASTDEKEAASSPQEAGEDEA